MCLIKSGLLAAALAAAVSGAPSAGPETLQRRALQTSAKPKFNGCTYTIDGLGSFTQALNIDFTKLKAVPKTLTVSTNTIAAGTAPFARQFMTKNVAVTNGCAALTVPGGQVADPIKSAELQTTAKDILYGSVRTVAMASSVQGTTHGFSFYSNDTQEADIAFLTDDTALLHLTNEQTGYGQPVTSYSVPTPSDATKAWHEYRMDWVPGKTMFYIDGKLVYQISQNVPSTPGFYLWNNWSNGNAWAKGPPQGDNTVKIQSINAYFNRTSISPNMNLASCKTAATQQQKGSSCQTLAATGSPYYDSNGVAYNLLCDNQVQGGTNLGSKNVGSFSACLLNCDGTKGCNGVAFTGGNGAGTCTYKNLTGVTNTPTANSNIDIAWLPSAYSSTGASNATASS
ncbi:putative glycosyl hydrolases family 16 protein [Elsinoe australis]|uniref:Putative glycosyl hydrolases family 16 protein n=1 Tax=Elsinoe australis TaxID=40998 RepID=A0A4V6DUK4_9PEZI|nr:putative glycosyl hydrolases family 16 protein [Elsinoe australis]